MTSDLRSQAARANGAKSRGPKTPDGKRRSSANSLRHGLLARTVVLEDENGNTFADLLAAFERDLHPQNEVERSLVENMAIGRWRLLRLWAIERASLKPEMERHDPEANDPPLAPPWPSAPSAISPAALISSIATNPASSASTPAPSACSSR